jgi:aromatic ring-cleaving dioxygenase
VQKIHPCPNNCILYHGEKYEHMDKCPVCTILQYKIRKNDPGDIEGKPPRKKVPAKVMWHAHVIPRLKCFFRNKEHAKLLRWHMEDRMKVDKLRHPADGWQWKKIEREFPDFASDARNLWFGPSTYGMNPFGEQSCSHSTWPVTLCIYNLPPWLCMKRKFIMMSVLIQHPKQPGNDIDVYLSPLVDELL